MALGKLARMAVDDAVGDEPGIADRLGGGALGAVRVGLVATSIVLVFDQLVPAGQQPAFLNGSQLRPLFSPTSAKEASARCRRSRRHHRPPEERTAHLAGAGSAAMHFGGRRALIRAAEVG